MKSDFLKQFKEISNEYPLFNSNEEIRITPYLNQFKILNSNPTDNFEIVKNNYKQLLKKYHPDIINGTGGSQEDLEHANRMIKEINEAYNLLKEKVFNNE